MISEDDLQLAAMIVCITVIFSSTMTVICVLYLVKSRTERAKRNLERIWKEIHDH